MSLPHYIQKAVDMDLLQVENGKVVGCNKEAVETIFGAARLVEKLQPTTAAKMDDTTDQEAIALCRVLSSPSGKARHLWSELRVAFGIGHGQNLPANLWSNDVFRAIGNEIDRTFLGERDSAIISRESLISQYSNLAAMSQLVPTIEFNKTVSELGAPESMNSYGDAKSEWDTALDLLRQHRVRALYRETLSMAEQVGRTDSKLEKNIEFLQSRSMECLGMLRGSIGQQGNFFDMTEDLFGTENHQGFLDIIANANAGSRPVSTGVLALDIDMEGGIRPADAAGGGRLFTLAARTGEGKCLSLNTPIIMADGSMRPVQDVREGDLVLGPDGTPRRVYGLARGRSEMYRVTPVKGDSYVVNSAHVLSLRLTGGQKNTLVVNGVRYRGGDIVNIEVLDYLKLNQRAKHMLKGWRSEAVEFHGAPVYDGPLTPYLAGVYLGDGHRHVCAVTLSDQEVVDELKGFCSSAGYSLGSREGRGCRSYFPSTERGKDNPIWSWVKDCRFKDEGKYIPESLKRGTVQQRLEVLAGIVDTDGHLEKKGTYELVFKERRFADDVVFVARSLGLAAYVAKCRKGIKSLNFTGDYYRIYISGDLDRIPCRVQRKKAQPRQQIKNVLNTGIKVESVGVDEYYGFAIEGDDKLFLLGDFTVTHNTQLGVQIAAQAAVSGLTAGFISAELDRPSIYARLWASVTAKCDCDSQFSGRIMAPPEGKKGEIQQSIMVGAQVIQDAGGKLLVEAPWGADVDAVISTMRSMKAKNPELRLVILDHFHCLARHKGAPSNESAMMEERAYKLMTIAKEIDIDLIILAQMNRVGMDTLSAKQPPTLDQIRGTDALSHVSHAVWILRKQMHDNDQGERASTGNLELWHAKVRGRQAYWNERTQSVDGVSGFIDKSVIRIHHPTSSIFPGKEGDDTLSRINEKASF